jgi:CPA2 family monovalent cation:H+ antiporter-2
VSGQSFLLQAFIYLTAAVVAVPIAKRLGLGSVLGYLLAGVAIGPHVLGLLGTEGRDVMHFAEFGVVMMLFVVGLELEPSLLWRLRRPILGMGGLQVLLTAAAVSAIGLALRMPWQAAVAVGMILSMSSTAIVLQTLNEKGLLKTAGGQCSFAVLLFQDIAVIPMLAVFPMLATRRSAPGEAGVHGGHALAALPGWVQTLAVLGAVTLVVVAGRYLIRPVFRAIARARAREAFTAAALLLVIAVALLMTAVGLSPALGAFLAGVMLATSEYRHELVGDIEPFKGLLLGLFFIAVGASIDFRLMAGHPALAGGLVIAVIAVKAAVLFGLARGFKLGTDQSLLFALGLPQVGEFAFVLLSFAGQEGVLGDSVTSPLVAVVAISMAVTPLLFLLNERLLQPRFGNRGQETRDADTIEEQAPVLVAGYGAFGSTVGRLLRANGVQVTVLDLDADRVDLLRAMGQKVHYGDASRLDLLHAAGAEQARLLILGLDSAEKTLELVETARKHFPNLTILARAFDWNDSFDLLDAGVPHVYRDTLDTAIRTGTDALRLLGFRAHQAHRAAQKFLKHDEESMRHLSGRRRDCVQYLSAARQRTEDLEQMLRADLEEPDMDRDKGWDPESLVEEYRSGPG